MPIYKLNRNKYIRWTCYLVRYWARVAKPEDADVTTAYFKQKKGIYNKINFKNKYKNMKL